MRRLSWRNAVMKVHGDEVTGNYFDLLGVQPEVGRFFHAADEHGPDSAPYVVLSDALWRSAFHADPGVVGTTVELNKHPFTVVGVAPAQFHGTERFVWPDYWMPMANEEQVEGSDYLHSRTSITVTVIGRLKPGVTPQQATENLNAIAAELAKEYPETDDGQPLRLIHPGLYGDDGDVIRGFLYERDRAGAAGAGGGMREPGNSVCGARGGSQPGTGAPCGPGIEPAAAGEATADRGGDGIADGRSSGAGERGPAAGCAEPVAAARMAHLAVSVDARVYLAGLALTLGSALLFGMVPAWQAWQSSPLQMMKSGPADAMHLRRFALRDLLLGAQIAICTLLVTASLVAVRGMVRALARSAGLPAAGRDAGRYGPEPGGTGRRRGGREKESDD